MPLTPGDWNSLPKTQGVGPDVGPGQTPPAWPVTIAMETPVVIPDNFDELPLEEQQALHNQYRFCGIRLRADIKDQSIQLTRETLDIP